MSKFEYPTINHTSTGEVTRIAEGGYEHIYSQSSAVEYFCLGLVSLGLVFINVVCIVIMAWILLKV